MENGTSKLGNRINKKFKFWLGIVLAPILVVASFFFLNSGGFFNVDKIDIFAVNSLEHPEYIQPFIQEIDKEFEAFRGQSLWQVNLHLPIEKFANKTWLKDIKISRRWPSGIEAYVEFKSIKYLMPTKMGMIRPVIEEGLLLDPVTMQNAPDVTILRGDLFEKRVDLRKRAVELMDHLPEDGKFSKKTVSEIQYSEKEGFWATMVENGLVIKLGHEQINQKSQRVGQVLEYMKSRSMDAQMIDANLSKKVLVKLKE